MTLAFHGLSAPCGVRDGTNQITRRAGDAGTGRCVRSDPTGGNSAEESDGLKSRMTEGRIDFAVIFQNVDRFYFTGTMQKGMVVIPVDGEPMVFVEKDIERAK